MQINIEGLDAVQAALEAKAAEIEKNLHKGIVHATRIVQNEARVNCPVSTEKTRPGGPHGELRTSIHGNVEGNTGTVGTNKEYAGYVEFGTYKMPAQPYLVPALKAKEGEVVDAIKAAVM